ncbi:MULTISPECIES: hypothetical protein [unclassified Saccharothrix]|uniref:hypothetical protein n=1 Tax=unclassified Saccharothrix TaxID=2593673 RepID=UPI00307DF535
MLFKVRDLMVSLLPGAVGDCTADTRCNGCTNQYSDCDGGCSNARSDFSAGCPEWRYDPADLEDLRLLVRYAQLRMEAAQIEAQWEKRAEENLDETEKRLSEALEETRRVGGELPDELDTPRTSPTAFRVKDLLVTVLPDRLGDDAAGSGCPGCTCVAGCSGATGCTNASTHIEQGFPEEAVLPELRLLLAAATARLDAGPGPVAVAPRTRGEADLLAERLTDALAGIARRRQVRDAGGDGPGR